MFRPTKCTARSVPTIRPFTETTPYAPNSPYSASKAASDHLVRAYHHTYGLPVADHQLLEQLRPVPVPRKADSADDPQCPGRQTAPVYGDGQNVRDWLYVDDHCAAIRAVLARGRLGETYNIGGCNETDQPRRGAHHLRHARRTAA